MDFEIDPWFQLGDTRIDLLSLVWHILKGQCQNLVSHNKSCTDDYTLGICFQMFVHLIYVQESGLKVNQQASFAVQLNGARGVIDAKVRTPSGAVEECYMSELDSGE